MTDNEDLEKHQPDEPVDLMHPNKSVFVVGGMIVGALVVLVVFLLIAVNVV